MAVSVTASFCADLDSLTLPLGFLSELGHFVIHTGHLELSAYEVSQLLAVPDPALLPLTTALRQARQQASLAMPPWARVERFAVIAWINDVLAFIPRRNEMFHWAIERIQWSEEEAPLLYLLDPHDRTAGLEISIEYVQELHTIVRKLEARATDLIDGLCYLTESGDLIDPMASLDGVGSGDLGFYIGFNQDWPEIQPRLLGGRMRRPSHPTYG